MIQMPHNFLALTHNQMETHGCVISTAAPVVPALSHQNISDYSAELLLNVVDQFRMKNITLLA